jgi:uncharacterized protein (DUF305 family)
VISWRVRDRRAAALVMSFVSAACTPAADNAKPNPEHAHPADSGMAGMSMPGLPAVVVPQGARYTVDDVRFMQGMIAHHAQAVLMARMANSHGANAQLLKFTLKIDQSQQAEIALMQWWLEARGQVVPDSNANHHMTMPGMLTAEQLKELDAARGKEFDRLFLVYMIQHHEGALKMVADLQAAPLSMQDPELSEFATGVDSDQRAEIGKMHQMLDEMK